MTRTFVIAVALCGALCAAVACRPPAQQRTRSGADTQARGPDDAVVRGAVLYATYCSGCHGGDGRGNGPVARTLGLRPTNLAALGAFATVSDDQLVDRLLHGAPLELSPPGGIVAAELESAAIAAYLPKLGTSDWDLLRTGRLIYEGTCAPCHGVYGRGEGVVGAFMAEHPADLLAARERYTDTALARVGEVGVHAMPPIIEPLDPGLGRALVAHIRHLSEGFRLYDTYCVMCHGDDGRGVHPEDLLLPATEAPPLTAETIARLDPKARDAKILHMVRREQGLMPHFRGTLTEKEIRDVIAYLRSPDV